MRWLIVLLIAAGACGGDDSADELRQGGDTTVDDRTTTAYTHPAANLTDTTRLGDWNAGRGPFAFHWEIPQLGPLFNNDACFGCHQSNGRGLSQIGPPGLVSQSLVRVSLATGEPDVPGGDVPLPGYGLQLQDHATGGLPEVIVNLTWVEHDEMYADGATEHLREPRVDIRTPGGAFLPADAKTSYRQAQATFGLGLLEAISDDELLSRADPDDANGDGISGRANTAWDSEQGAARIGRFGHKATEVSLRQQMAAAFANDIGLSNKLLPESDGMRDVPDDQFEQVQFFISMIAVPAAAERDSQARRGRDVFDRLGCATCHTPTIVTGDHPIPELAHQTIHPWTDMLLHDVGDLLTDARSDFDATGVEWRTPPLWGLGLVQLVNPQATFLHDGRARTVAEAILWHGGEAMTAREAFRTAPKDDRDALLAFLSSL